MFSPPRPACFYQEATYEPRQSVGHLLRRLMGTMRSGVDKRLEAHGLTHAQWEPLFKLRRGVATTVAEVAREMQTDPGATTRLLDRLEAKGLCRRERSTEDRRVVNLVLTPEGEAVADKVPPVLCDVMNAHLAGFSQEEWQTLLGYLERMVANGEALRGNEPAASVAEAPVSVSPSPSPTAPTAAARRRS